MIGIILTGHGKISSGIMSSVKMVYGETLAVKSVDFLPEDSTDVLKENIRKEIEKINEEVECDGIICLCDIAGGSPFKMCAELSLEINNIEVISGMNLPMVIGLIGDRDFTKFNEILEFAYETGREEIKKFELKKVERSQNDDFEDGI